MEFAQRMQQLESAIFSQQEVLKRELIAKGKEVFNFSVGTPDLPPPDHVMQVMSEESAKAENYKYAIKDSEELVAAVADWYLRRFDVTLAPEEILGLNGSQDALAHASFALVNPGDGVLIQDPYYPIFFVGPYLSGARIETMPLYEENNYLIDFERIKPAVAHGSKLMIVSYPNNPVTALAPQDFYERLVWFAKKYEVMVIHDNAYCELVYDGKKAGSFLNIPGAKDIGIELNSLSKSYNIPGCRISFALGNKEIIKKIGTIKSHIDYGIFIPIQKAAIAAISGPDTSIRQTVAIYQKRRDLLVEGFSAIGWAMKKPEATMFVWAKIPPGFTDSAQFALEMIRETGVFTVPGACFGKMGEGYVRFALVDTEEKINRAVQKVGYWLKNRTQ
ncbi:MAG: aminotransferase class I/II-fold pyridoxal phosphate-dependent enzyme [Vallitaleaceae bacterium]|nr:aminotransferase class I/II-fold pyridoxal phosphate-dependent enzyme [Vallitaleaceae bacterium]